MASPLPSYVPERPPGGGRPRQALSVFLGLLGAALMIGTVAAMNRPVPRKPADSGGAERVIAFDKAPKPPKSSRPPPPARKSPPAKGAPPAAPILTGAALAGLSFGLSGPGVTGVAVGQAADRMLGGADASRLVMTEEAVDKPPRPAERAAPRFPPRARAKNLTGHVSLNLLIDADGAVRDARVLDAVPPGVFEEAALEAVRAWRFDPATYQGKPVKVWARQTLRFELE